MMPLGDEAVGLYLHVATALLHGALPYVTAFEYKPPGLFIAYALSAGVVPNAAVAVQLLAAAASVLSALAVARLADDRLGVARSATGRIAALFVVALSIEHDGWAGDAEVLLAPFIAWSIALAVRPGPSVRRALAIGFLSGAALQLKFTVAPIALVPIALLIVRSASPRRAIRNAVLAVVGICVPIVGEIALYARAGALEALVDANVGASLRRASAPRSVLLQNVRNVGLQIRDLAPAIEFAPFAGSPRSVVVTAGYAWVAAAAIAIAGPGEFYARHFALLEAPVALLGALGLERCCASLRRSGRGRTIAAVVVVMLSFGLHDFYEVEQGVRLVALAALGRPRPQQPIDAMTAFLLSRGDGAHRLYVVGESPWLYDRVDAPPPTRFVDSDHLLERGLARMAHVDPRRELERIFATRPALVLVGDLTADRLDRHVVADLRVRLARNYVRIGSVAGAIAYERRAAADAALRAR